MCKDIEKNLLIHMCLSVDKSRTKPYPSTPNKHHLQVVSYLWVGIYEKYIYIYIVWVHEKTQRVKAFVSMLDYLSFIPEPHGRRRGKIHSGYLWSLHMHIACMWIWEVSLYAVSMFYYYWLIKQLIWSITSQNRVRREI